MTISRMQQPRQMYQEGGIMPRLNQLGSGVSSAEQMLQGINQRLDSAESTLGGGDPASGLMAIQPNNQIYQPQEISGFGQPLFDKDGFRLGDQRYGIGLVGGPPMALPGLTNQTPGAGLGNMGELSPLASAMRGRQNYGLGSFVKSIGKGVKKAVGGIKDFVKSDIGKVALLAAGGYYLGGGNLFGLQRATDLGKFSFGQIPGANLLKGGKNLIKGGIESLGLGVPKGEKPTFGQFAKVFGLGSLGGAALQALQASGAEEGDVRDIDALRSYLRQGYRQLNPEASDADIDAFVEQNTVEYRANGGRIGYNQGTGDPTYTGNNPEDLPRGLKMDTTTRNPIPEDALPKEIEMISKIMLGPGSAGIGEPEDGTMKGYQFFRNQYLPKKIKELSENFGYSEDEIYKMINTRIREYVGTPGKPKMAMGGRMKYAMGDSAEQNAMQASGIMNLPLNQNPAGVTELDLRETGGFIPPVGVKEKADDIPAMLSNNEFVFTADAVRGMGGGDVEKGAQRLYDQMKMLEEGGRVA